MKNANQKNLVDAKIVVEPARIESPGDRVVESSEANVNIELDMSRLGLGRFHGRRRRRLLFGIEVVLETVLAMPIAIVLLPQIGLERRRLVAHG